MSTSGHPGVVEIVEVHGNRTRMLPASAMPESEAFVVEGDPLVEPTAPPRRTPVVRMVIVSSRDGRIVAPEDAARITVRSYGSDGRLLRTATLHGRGAERGRAGAR